MMHSLRESYSDGTSTRNSSHSNSSSMSQLSPPLASTPLSTPPLNSRTSLSYSAQEFVPLNTGAFAHSTYGLAANDNKLANQMNSSMGVFPPFPFNVGASTNLLQQCNQSQLLLRRQLILAEKQQILHKQQQEYAAAANIAKQQYLLSTATNRPQDEIANSLKMFALSSSCRGNEAPQSPVDEVMQDFATNGYSADDLNRYRQYPAVSNMQSFANANSFLATNNFNSGGGYDFSISPNNGGVANLHLIQQQQLLYESINNSYNELWRQHFLNLLPGQLLRHAEARVAAAAATNAATINMEYNNQNPRPTKKIFKKETQVLPRRCVFCENNNEPEAVVKSHAVRDSQGRVLCPKLRVYVCPICKASGDDAHTVKYCPQKPIVTMEDAMKAESYRLPKAPYVQKQLQMKF